MSFIIHTLSTLSARLVGSIPLGGSPERHQLLVERIDLRWHGAWTLRTTGAPRPKLRLPTGLLVQLLDYHTWSSMGENRLVVTAEVIPKELPVGAVEHAVSAYIEVTKQNLPAAVRLKHLLRPVVDTERFLTNKNSVEGVVAFLASVAGLPPGSPQAYDAAKAVAGGVDNDGVFATAFLRNVYALTVGEPMPFIRNPTDPDNTTVRLSAQKCAESYATSGTTAAGFVRALGVAGLVDSGVHSRFPADNGPSSTEYWEQLLPLLRRDLGQDPYCALVRAHHSELRSLTDDEIKADHAALRKKAKARFYKKANAKSSEVAPPDKRFCLHSSVSGFLCFLSANGNPMRAAFNTRAAAERLLKRLPPDYPHEVTLICGWDPDQFELAPKDLDPSKFF
jgi:hypothetical protein